MLASTSYKASVLLKSPLTAPFLEPKKKLKREKYAKLRRKQRKGWRREANPLRRSVEEDLTSRIRENARCSHRAVAFAYRLIAS